MSNFYPPFGRMFDEMKYSKKLAYTPERLTEEFTQYIQSLADDDVEIEVEYRRMSRRPGSQGGVDNKDLQVRREKLHRAPKITDFVVRWLGKSMSWWSMLETGKHAAKYAKVKEIITQYCYDVKFDGAVLGLYNASIIARDIGLKETIRVESRTSEKDMSIDEVKAEIARINKLGE